MPSRIQVSFMFLSLGMIFLASSFIIQAQERAYLDDIQTIQELQNFVNGACPDSEKSLILQRFERQSQKSVDEFIRDVVSEGCFPCCFCCGDHGDCCSECEDNNSLTTETRK